MKLLSSIVSLFFLWIVQNWCIFSRILFFLQCLNPIFSVVSFFKFCFDFCFHCFSMTLLYTLKRRCGQFVYKDIFNKNRKEKNRIEKELIEKEVPKVSQRHESWSWSKHHNMGTYMISKLKKMKNIIKGWRG